MPPVREIPPHQGDPLVDFSNFFAEPPLVAAGLLQFAACLGNAICYCLQFRHQPGNGSWFEPYGIERGLNGLVTESGISLPRQIRFESLMTPKGWPVLAEWQCDDVPAQHPAGVAEAVWHGQGLVRGNNEHVGYFKAAIPSGQPPNDEQVRDAYRKATFLVQTVVQERAQLQIWQDPGFQASLASTSAAITGDLRDGRSTDAVQRVCTLVTSHLGADLNRIVCLVPQGPELLRSIYGHGGDCSDGFSQRVQRPLALTQHTIPQVIGAITGRPTADPLYQDLVLNPLILEQGSNAGLLGQLWWQHGGNLDWLPEGKRVEVAANVDVHLPTGMVRLKRPRTLAAILRSDDPAIAAWQRSRPSSPLFLSRNGTYFAIPWTCPQEHDQTRLLGLIVCDLGYWSHFDVQYDVVPRLMQARALLDWFAPHFLTVGWGANVV